MCCDLQYAFSLNCMSIGIRSIYQNSTHLVKYVPSALVRLVSNKGGTKGNVNAETRYVVISVALSL
jgi:hypothetical protein